MSILIIQLPARTRLGADQAAAEAGAAAAPVAPKEYSYVLSADGLSVLRQGRCTAPLLPAADSVVAVMAATDISWHRLTLPKAPQARLRAALASMLFEDTWGQIAVRAHQAAELSKLASCSTE